MHTKQKIRAFAVKVAADHADCPNCMMDLANYIAHFVDTGEVIWFEGHGSFDQDDHDPFDQDDENNTGDPLLEMLESLDPDDLPKA